MTDAETKLTRYEMVSALVAAHLITGSFAWRDTPEGVPFWGRVQTALYAKARALSPDDCELADKLTRKVEKLISESPR